ncbi:hypothetical protein pb186bvf_007897 [Paramecium bursaria]
MIELQNQKTDKRIIGVFEVVNAKKITNPEITSQFYQQSNSQILLIKQILLMHALSKIWERKIIKTGKRKQVTYELYDNEIDPNETSKRIQLNDDFDNLDQNLKKYCNIDVSIQSFQLEPVFEDSIRVDDQGVTQSEQQFKKNIKYNYMMEDYNEFKTLKVSEIDYVEEYDLDKKEKAQHKPVLKKQNLKKISKNKF